MTLSRAISIIIFTLFILYSFYNIYYNLGTNYEKHGKLFITDEDIKKEQQAPAGGLSIMAIIMPTVQLTFMIAVIIFVIYKIYVSRLTMRLYKDKIQSNKLNDILLKEHKHI